MEFGLMIPIMVLLLVGGIEITRVILFHQKIDNATFRVGDLITQLNLDSVPCTGTGGLEWNRNTMLVEAMRPYDFDTTGVLIVSAVEAEYPDPATPDDDAPLRQEVVWQWISDATETSRIGTEGALVSAPPAWPAVFGLSPNAGGMYDGDRVIAVEVFYRYEPLFPGFELLVPMTDVMDVYKTAFYRARFANLRQLGADCP